MRVIWAVSFEAFERPYIEDFLFGDFEFLELENCLLPTFPDDLIVVAGSQAGLEPKLERVWSKIRHSNFYVISDEVLQHRDTPFKGARACFRNYPFPRWAGENSWALPLGFNGGMVGARPPSRLRELAWSFAGELKNSRQQMISCLGSIKPNFIHPTRSWADPLGLSAAGLLDLYSRSHFVPCPPGNVSPDSFRIMEALQAGAIPVVLRFYGFDYFRLIFGDHPFVVARSWKEAEKKLASLLADEVALSTLHERVNAWYERFLSDMRIDIQALVDGEKLHNLRGSQFRIQRRASFNIWLRLVFWYHYRRPVSTALKRVRLAWDRTLVITRITRIIRFRRG